MGIFDWLTGGGAKNPPQRRDPQPRTQFRAAEVIPCSAGSCNAVRAIAGTRFLEQKVPKLPLRECDRPACNCTYRRHPDRRSKVRRAADLDGAVAGRSIGEARDRRDHAAHGRRAGEVSPQRT